MANVEIVDRRQNRFKTFNPEEANWLSSLKGRLPDFSSRLRKDNLNQFLGDMRFFGSLVGDLKNEIVTRIRSLTKPRQKLGK